MSRWNIASIFFLGMDGQRRILTFEPGAVNIVTGASGTGKSTLIKAIDYCLGSRRCELPVHVRRRCVAVGVKWTNGDAEMIVGRLIPPVGQNTSNHMFVISGRDLSLPASTGEFQGATTVDAAKAYLERAFGIGDLPIETDMPGGGRGRATVRLVTPYLFVTKEVIYSESVLLHGLDRTDKAHDIVATMPYFLRVADEASAMDEHRLRQLRRALEKEEDRAKSRKSAETALKRRAANLLVEARRIGIAEASSSDVSELSEAELLVELAAVLNTRLEASVYPTEDELGRLHSKRRELLMQLGAARRDRQAMRIALGEATGFGNAVVRQRDKLMLAEHLHIEKVATACPLCDSPSERGQDTARALRETLLKVRAESVAVETVKPKLIKHDRVLDEEIGRLNGELRSVDDQIRTWLRQSNETRQLADLAQLRAHLLGRISFFFEAGVDESRQPSRDLSVLRGEIAELESRLDRGAKEVKLRHAEFKVSQFASEAFAMLPTVAPCIGSELYFSSRRPEVTVIEAKGGAILRMPDVGSDQNYLAIHIALSFALQRYFEAVNAPVPGLIVLDQISRPYFPTSSEDEDEREIYGREEDEDVQAMRRHIDFLFSETSRRTGLQVLLIEHAYFGDDSRYVKATRERWTRASGRALIPLDWPLRSES